MSPIMREFLIMGGGFLLCVLAAALVGFLLGILGILL